ncbi:neural Wiskott-Aldrich syndrome protein-like isoform X1 [Salarias fasciatus]|uniref:neural Wiskott-Aldrich syndrome protein-like isoform X1 n=1 Tax=Salarias fasciatus TaxID=181472 RepID=UPI001177051B|nr:neural Wiskott-Aldrich syndrome protein-like isoform X1 [Salarias fasciatus]
MHHCASACPVALATGAAASAPASAAGRVWAACWAPQKPLTVWKRTTCSPPARQEGDPAAPRGDAALPRDSAAMQRAAILTSPASWRRRETNQTANSRAATPVISSSGSCNWPATLLLTGSTNEPPPPPLPPPPRPRQNRSIPGDRTGLVIVFPCLSS